MGRPPYGCYPCRPSGAADIPQVLGSGSGAGWHGRGCSPCAGLGKAGGTCAERMNHLASRTLVVLGLPGIGINHSSIGVPGDVGRTDAELNRRRPHVVAEAANIEIDHLSGGRGLAKGRQVDAQRI
jgi:hypothetical protein